MSGSVLYAKNWLRNDRRPHDIRPRNHIRNVHTGRVGSSVLATVSRTSSIGETSSFWSLAVVSSLVVVEREDMACFVRVV